MAIGDWHEFADGYRFQETLHGPNVERSCIDCGHVCYSIPGWPEPRCEECSIAHHGALRPVDRMKLQDRGKRKGQS